jgi:3-hydroxyanthranilate 3,4-dioxygenase
MATLKPFNLNQWIEKNRHLLKPPVGNKNIYVDSEDYIVMIVAGPNARKDYHYNETEELFYQLEGNIKVIIQENGERKEMELNAGDMYLHPSKNAAFTHTLRKFHRFSHRTQTRRKRFKDGLLWFCENCNHKLHEVYFELQNIEKDFLPHYQHFYNSKDLRTCKKCGTIMETDPIPLSIISFAANTATKGYTLLSGLGHFPSPKELLIINHYYSINPYFCHSKIIR